MKNLHFDSIANKSVVDRIIDSVTDAISSGALRPGDQMPTEMELVESLGVSRNSVREAVKILEAIGVVEIRRAEGTFVSSGFKNRMLDPLVYGLILENGSAQEVIELRRIFEAGVMQLAVEKATPADIQATEAALAKLRKAARHTAADAQALYEADLEFHKVLEEAAHNSLTVKIGQIINRLTTPTRQRAVSNFLQRGEVELFISLHQQLYDVLACRDVENMRSAIEDHYRYWKEQFAPASTGGELV